MTIKRGWRILAIDSPVTPDCLILSSRRGKRWTWGEWCAANPNWTPECTLETMVGLAAKLGGFYYYRPTRTQR